VPVSPSLHKFQAVESVSDGYALLYIYYPYTVVAHNAIYNTSLSVSIYLRDKTIIQMPNKGYTWIELKPGQYKVGAKWTRAQGIVSPARITADISVAAGSTYYLKISHTGNTWLGPSVGGQIIGLPQTVMEDIAAAFELETKFNGTGLPWCNYSKADVAKM